MRTNQYDHDRGEWRRWTSHSARIEPPRSARDDCRPGFSEVATSASYSLSLDEPAECSMTYSRISSRRGQRSVANSRLHSSSSPVRLNSARSPDGNDKSCTAIESISRKKLRNGSIRPFNRRRAGSSSANLNARSRTLQAGIQLATFPFAQNLAKQRPNIGFRPEQLPALARAVNLVDNSPREQLPQIHADIAPRNAQPVPEVVRRPFRARDVKQGK